MSEEKKKKTLRAESLDFLLEAVAPIFIIGMIGSLVFFLINVFYSGGFKGHLMWNLGLYTFAAVLVARIAIAQSRPLAIAYLMALAASTLAMTPQVFVIHGPLSSLSMPITVALLAVVAVLADRITFDCALMGERSQSSGVGLLQSLGLVRSERKQASKKKEVAVQFEQGPAGKETSLYKIRRHNPGTWVLYFALLALPVFGLGQFFIRDPSSRWSGFIYLFVYLLCSFCLLVLIALLSLRKYLRERGVPMETSFAIRWLLVGMTSVLLLLGLIALLPLPSQSMFAFEPPIKFTDRENLKAHPWGWGEKGVQGENPKPGDPQQNGPQDPPRKGGPGRANQGGAPDPEGQAQQQGAPHQNGSQGNEQGSKQGDQKGDQKGNQPAPGDSPAPKSSERNEAEKSDGDQPKQDDANNDPKDPGQREQQPNRSSKPDEANRRQNAQRPQNEDNAQPPDENDSQQPDANAPPRNENQPPQEQAPPNDWSPSLEWNIPSAFRWLLMLILAIVAIVFGFIYRREIANAMAEYIRWLSGLLGRKVKRSTEHVVEDDPTLIESPFPPFQSFANPFASGQRWTHEQIVRHMYRACLSWGYEHRITRHDDETPEEYMRRLARRFPQQQEHIGMLGSLYNRIAYARGTVSSDELKPLNELWKWFCSSIA
ncbi:MAG: DUF4129 domain-containing protein [Pirellula sp.]